MLTGTATAQCGGGYGGYGGGYGWGIGRLYETLDRPLDRRVPYFAAHPPVYYSYPVARPYGYTPFAYMPHVQTPEIIEAPMGPQEIMNPYVPSEAQPSETPSDSAIRPSEPGPDTTTQLPQHPQPLLVINPYVGQSTQQQEDGLVRVARNVH
jgi:hypothetical protein